ATRHQQAIFCCPIYLHQNTRPSFSLAILIGLSILPSHSKGINNLPATKKFIITKPLVLSLRYVLNFSSLIELNLHLYEQRQ
ncbi:hypothetical protein, partial [Bartonella grahamii]|uniref:hypothetical protein n=1 Tax=Bartonella grahamii TaxID=33045 RepID=UPI002360EC21